MEKIRFSDPRVTKTVELPSFKGSQVEVYTSLTVGEQREILAKFPNAKNPDHADAQNATIAMIVRAIKTWNFTDENDADLPITEEIFAKFPSADLLVLAEVVTGKKLLKEESSSDLSDDKKKD